MMMAAEMTSYVFVFGLPAWLVIEEVLHRWREIGQTATQPHPEAMNAQALLFVVSRDHRARYEYLKCAFANDPQVGVVLDRRHQERRQGHLTPVADRRRGDRRRANIEINLRSLGWALAETPPREDRYSHQVRA